MKIKIRHCHVADKEHDDCKRQYAHTYHFGSDDNFNAPEIICVAKSFNNLPIEHQMGILAHEIGHLLAGYEADEITADIVVRNVLDVRIRYKNSEWGNNLQFLNKKDIKVFEEAIKKIR